MFSRPLISSTVRHIVCGSGPKPNGVGGAVAVAVLRGGPQAVHVRHFVSFLDTFKKLMKERMAKNAEFKEVISQVEASPTMQKTVQASEAVTESLKRGKEATSEAVEKAWEASKPVREVVNSAATRVASDPLVQASVEAIRVRVERLSKTVDDMENSDIKEYRKKMYDRLKYSSVPEGQAAEGGSSKDGSMKKQNTVDKDNAPYGGAVENVDINTTAGELLIVEQEPDAAQEKGWKRVKSWFSLKETEDAQVMGELYAKEPDFNLEFFLKFLEKDLIPQVLEASISGDLDFLRGICAEPAFKSVATLVEYRRTQSVVVDPRILDVRQVRLASAKFVEDEPVLLVAFQAQQVNCVRDLTGKVLYGAENDIRNNHYIWVLRHDPAQKEPRWEVVEMAVQASLPTM
ncbi:mitochondrial presequence translocase-assisted motor (PAM complex) Tim44 subunit [Andalucia godoyi]|uniref:Mitochondrial presequence translocase-assisted motor (PAM complex) Tim44 subunit n=1 Tax=Andalucia godoyi TaxID=505711 RepID=A0A8K0AIF9_ANDGO|nr:mitochondrial presequence translocase-assisted motor (PAM complex) Tim44 subunit [Andalucia godoyi]|eukprot:ANDGO_02582.mRNA.1 mitochondrial presequence translocase-assisted motor (PAM complex) Tim44 subunit